MVKGIKKAKIRLVPHVCPPLQHLESELQSRPSSIKHPLQNLEAGPSHQRFEATSSSEIASLADIISLPVIDGVGPNFLTNTPEPAEFEGFALQEEQTIAIVMKQSLWPDIGVQVALRNDPTEPNEDASDHTPVRLYEPPPKVATYGHV